MTERRSVTAWPHTDHDESVWALGCAACFEQLTNVAALPAEPTELAGALDVERLHQAISDGLFLIAGSNGDMCAQDWREADTRDVITRARLAPSEPRADSEGLERLAQEWDALADATGERVYAGDPAAAIATINTLRACAAALRREQPAAEGEREVERG